MRYQIKRTDHNQQEIMDALRACGWIVKDLHEVGGGFPDLIVANQFQENILIEVKQPGKKLNELELKFFKEWPGNKIIAYSGEDAINKLQEFRGRGGLND